MFPPSSVVCGSYRTYLTRSSFAMRRNVDVKFNAGHVWFLGPVNTFNCQSDRVVSFSCCVLSCGTTVWLCHVNLCKATSETQTSIRSRGNRATVNIFSVSSLAESKTAFSPCSVFVGDSNHCAACNARCCLHTCSSQCELLLGAGSVNTNLSVMHLAFLRTTEHSHACLPAIVLCRRLCSCWFMLITAVGIKWCFYSQTAKPFNDNNWIKSILEKA